MHETEYQKDLIEALKDPAEAAAYLNAALEEGDRETFLLALRNCRSQWRHGSGSGQGPS